jgi:hypothetical protein
MLYDFVIWAGRRCTLSRSRIGVMVHRRIVNVMAHGRSRSAAHRAAPAPPAVHQRRVTTLPAACRTGAAPRPASRRTRARTRPPVLARRAHAPAGPRWLGLARDETRTSAGSWRLLVYPGHALVTRYRAAPGLDATTARVRLVRAPGERERLDLVGRRELTIRLGPGPGALPSSYRSIYTLSRSRRSNMQPARDHLNSITVVCASPRRAAPLRLHRPHVARVYRTTGPPHTLFN